MNSSPAEPRWPAVVFDLDGTLADTVELIVASYQHAFTTVLGHEVDPVLIRSWIGRPLPTAFAEYDAEHADELLATYLPWNAANTERLIRSYAGVAELLTALDEAGVRVGIATSKRRESAQQAMDILGITPHAQVLVALEDTDRHKPDPTPLVLALDRLGCAAASAVYVGDAAVDVLAGRAAGMSTVAVTWGAGTLEQLNAAQPTAVVSTPEELAAVLLRPAAG